MALSFQRREPGGPRYGVSRRTAITAAVAGVALAFGGCAPGVPGEKTPIVSPSENVPPATPETKIPENIFNASWEQIKPLTNEQLYPQSNPKFLPDYLMGKDMSDDGHLDEVPKLFAINLDPSDYETDEDFVKAYVKEWFDRYNSLHAIGLSGRNDGVGTDRDRLRQTAIEMYSEMTGNRKDATVNKAVVNSILVSGSGKMAYDSIAPQMGMTPEYPIANVWVPDMDSIKFTGSRKSGISKIDLDARRVWKVDEKIIEASIGPSPNFANLDGVTQFTISDVKVNSNTNRVAAKSTWSAFKNNLG